MSVFQMTLTNSEQTDFGLAQSYQCIKQTIRLNLKITIMKRIFTLSVVAIAAMLILGACSKDRYYVNDENYWLSQERGEIIYSDAYCNYYVVESNYGYTVIRSYGGYKPFEGDIVYGNFSFTGTRDIYNRSTGDVFTGTITDYRLSYNGALNAIDYYCPLGTKSTSNGKFRSETK